MKKVLKIVLAIVLAIVILGLGMAFVSTSALASTGTGSIWLKTPFMRLWNAIHGMQDQITGLAVMNGTPGSQGEPGPQGPAGPAGECSCPISLADFQSLSARVESLEKNLAGGGGMMPDCILDSDCDDNNPCTDDACNFEVGCVYSDNGLCNGTGGSDSSDGNLIVTEIMYNPNAVTDTSGEWFEIYNAGSTAVNLNGWSIKDQGTDHFTFSDNIIIIPDDYATLCKNIDNSVNGGIVCDAGYSSFTLGNTADAIVLVRPDSSTSDEITYDAAAEPWKSLNKAGYSLQLDPDRYNSADNDDGANWCNGIEPISGGDFGTPGGINSQCTSG
jgi:hypothetical protein